MKTSIALLPLSFALLISASPLGNHATFRRHNGVPTLGRRFILQSRMNSPAACAAKAVSANVTSTPDLSGTAAPPANTTVAANSTTSAPDLSGTAALPANTTTAVNTTSTNNTTATTTGNTTTIDPTTTIDNSTTAANTTTASRRSFKFWSRIAQDDIPAVAQKWQDLCLASGGDIFTNDPCVVLAGLNGINALQADADTCAQQDVADAMITFAKSKGVTNEAALVVQALAFRRHPRNAIEMLGVLPSTIYCQRAPKNLELVGVVNEQLDGVDPGLFGSPSTPIMPFGADGTCPFGTTPDVATCSCTNGTETAGAVTATNSSVNSTDASTATGDSAGSASDTAGAATATDISAAASATDSAALTATDSAASTAATDSASATDSSANIDSTSPVDTNTVSVSAATPAPTAAVTTATAKSSGPNFQPSDISGDVNDING